MDGAGGAGGNAILRLEPATTTVFSTGFETNEGYSTAFTLAGQSGWTNIGAGGNGIVSNFFAGQGQQAFLGFSSPVPAGTTALYRPLSYSVDTNTRPLIQFSVMMQIVDSNSGSEDQFWWLLRNAGGHTMFGLEFD